MKNLVACALVALAAAGCAKDETKAQIEDRSTAQPSTGTTQPPSTGSTTRPTTSDRVGGNPLTDPSSPLSKRSVYFDFDSNEVKEQYQPVIQAETRYLTQHPGARLRIEGNCDERGSREYNLALGQRRAEAVKHVMTVMGARGNNIETVSFGEEKPVAQGHDEAAWAKNRRDDFRYISR